MASAPVKREDLPELRFDSQRLEVVRGSLDRLGWFSEPHGLFAHERYQNSSGSLNEVCRGMALGIPISAEDFTIVLEPQEVVAWEEIGLVMREGSTVNPCFALGCIGGVGCVTDLRSVSSVVNDNKLSLADEPMIVMPFYGETRLFAEHEDIPRNRVESALDLCTGSGIHALLAAKHSLRATGTDLNRRALRLARFNAALNRCENVDFRHGSIWDAVEGERFDLITANPPYQPDPTNPAHTNWWGAGARGDVIWKEILRRSSEFLKPGGSLHMVMHVISWFDEPFEEACESSVRGQDIELELTIESSEEPEAFMNRYGISGVESAEYGILTAKKSQSGAEL